MTLTIRPATEADIAPLAATMRPKDVSEVWASDGCSPTKALEHCLRDGDATFAVEARGEVAGMFGVKMLDASRARVWFLSGQAIEAEPLAFLKLARRHCRELADIYGELCAAIDARYLSALRFFRLVGFELGLPTYATASGLPFIPVTMKGAAHG